MMAYSEDHIVLAAEYALGTLDAGERVQVQTMMAIDHDFAAICEMWEYRLGVLNQMVGLVEPRAEVWERIKAAIMRTKVEVVEPAELKPITEGPTSAEPIASAAIAAPELEASDAVEAPVEVVAAPDASAPPQDPPDDAPSSLLPALPREESESAVTDANLIRLTSKVRQLRSVANVMTALAAALLVLMAVQVYRPDLLPNALRAKPRVQEAKAPAAPQFVAVLQKDGSSPAFILTVDAGSKNFTVRKVGAEAEAGKSYELWLVSDKFQAPRSLGVIGGDDFTTRPALSSYDPDTVSNATYAVSVEPEGGSPTGSATGPIVFSGKLIETVPAPGAATSPR
jgi:anti-sigma-K factor RskA